MSSSTPARWPVAVAAVAATALAGCAVLPATGPALEPVVIAADLALSGPAAELDAVYHRALELRVEQVNRQRSLAGRELRLEIRDNRSDPATSVANLTDLVERPEVAAVVTGGCAGCLLAGVEVVEAAEVPTLALAAGEAVAAPVGQRQYVFQLAPVGGDSADRLAAELATAGFTGFGLVTTDDGDGYGAQGGREMAAAAAAAGVELVLHERLRVPGSDGAIPRDGATGGDATGGSDEQAVARRIAGWPPPPDPAGQPLPDPVVPAPSEPAASEPAAAELAAVVLWTPPAAAEQLAAALREAGWSGQLWLEATAAGPLFHGDRAAALTGARLVFVETLAIDQAIAATPAKAARQAWWRDYLSRYGGYDAYSSFAADAVEVVVAAVNRVGTTDRQVLRDTIEATSLDGLSGPIRFTPENHSGLQPLAWTVLIAAPDRWRLPG